jgi:two-component system LytT family sensor kinase
MTKLKEPARIELIAFTVIVIVAFLFNAFEAVNEHLSIQKHVYYERFWIHLLFTYVITCLSYFLLFFYVSPETISGAPKSTTAIILVCLFIEICFIAGLINPYFAIILAIKMVSIYILSIKNQEKQNIAQDALLLFAVALFVHAVAVVVNYSIEYAQIFSSILPIAILHYLYILRVTLPDLNDKKRMFWKFIGRILLTTVACQLLIVIMILAFDIVNGAQEYLIPLNIGIQLIAVPLISYFVYKSRLKRDQEEIRGLKTELGKSDANLNFLKSQINPHFLFNALNTLYGTALQENAERTGEGIQKLGDMMRFMLEENVADKTLLATDIDYLKNYISLQKLRITASPNINIETDIEEPTEQYLIAPMMLLPFVENAFKHGISLNTPSHVKLTIQAKDGKLYLDVSNSINKASETDPERLHGGIGLQNVKQRLSLLYPGRHELIIRENAKEFFVHLTLELSEID